MMADFDRDQQDGGVGRNSIFAQHIISTLNFAYMGGCDHLNLDFNGQRRIYIHKIHLGFYVYTMMTMMTILLILF